jgi:putative transposase
MIGPMLGFKSWPSARILLAGIETMHMIRENQLSGRRRTVSAADQFYSLAY